MADKEKIYARMGDNYGSVSFKQLQSQIEELKEINLNYIQKNKTVEQQLEMEKIRIYDNENVMKEMEG